MPTTVLSEVLPAISETLALSRSLRAQGRAAEALEQVEQALLKQDDSHQLQLEGLLCANELNDWTRVVSLAGRVRRSNPDAVAAHRLACVALRHLGRPSEACELLEDAKKRFGDSRWLNIEYARSALDAGRLDTAVNHAALAQQQDPGNEQGYLVSAAALSKRGSSDEALEVLELGRKAIPKSLKIADKLASSLMKSDRFQRARQLATALRRSAPEHPLGYRLGIWATMSLGDADEAAQISAQAVESCPDDIGLLSETARVSRQLGRQIHAKRIAAMMQARFPEQPEGYIAGIEAHVLGLDLAAAESLSHEMVSRLPQHAESYLQLSQIHWKRGSTAAAESALVEAIRKFPERADVAAQYVLLPVMSVYESKRDWQEAFKRAEELRRQFPKYRGADLKLCARLRACGDFFDAEQLVQRVLREEPGSPEANLESARIALDDGLLASAIERFQFILEKRPKNVAALTGLSIALSRNGETERAMESIRSALAVAPANHPVLQAAAEIAKRGGDEASAEKHMESLRRMFPTSMAYAFWRYAKGSDAGIASPVSQEHSFEVDEKLSAIYSRFESLGGRNGGCEFGLVQRTHGVDHLGLLRFCAISPENLLEAVSNDFENVGSPEQTRVYANPYADLNVREWFAADTRFSFEVHTFQFDDEWNHETVLMQSCRRFAFLRRKLLQELDSGKKIFVVGYSEEPPSDTMLRKIQSALSKSRQNWLLTVRPSEECQPPGSIRRIDERILVGHVAHPGFVEGAEQLTPDVASWNQICEATVRLRDETEQSQPACNPQGKNDASHR